jgi:hypothetical protein
MADGKDRRLWSHTAAMLCLLANIHRDPEKQRRPFTVDQWNPYAERPKAVPISPELQKELDEFDAAMLRKTLRV